MGWGGVGWGGVVGGVGFMTHLSAIDQIGLVTHKHDNDVMPTLVAHVVDPLARLLERRLACPIRTKHHAWMAESQKAKSEQIPKKQNGRRATGERGDVLVTS